MNKKRFFALFLAAAMVLGLAAPTVSAAQDTVIVDDNAVIKGAGVVKIVEEEVTLTVKGQVGTITVTEDGEESEIIIRKGSVVKEILVEGEDTEITVQKGATVQNIVLNAEAEVEGKGTVDSVYVYAEEAEINVPGTKVTVGPNAEEVEAGDTELKPGDVVVINPNGNGVKPWEPEPEIPEVPQAHLVEQAKLVDLGWSKFVAVRFAEGHNPGNTTLTVDGVSINSNVTSVTDDSSVVKWEVTSPSHAELVVTSGEETQTVALGGSASAPQLVEAGTPDYFLLNGPVYVWDYHLTNYDDAGNIRVAPARTTMSLGAQPEKMAHFSPDAIVHEDPSNLPYMVSGEVQLMFNYAAGTEAERAYVDGITDVDLVSFSEYHNTLNDTLTYTLDKNFAHGDHTVACIQVPIGQTNFVSNGRYNLRVTSNGKADLYPIHLVQETVPTMTVTGDTGYYGNEVHFRIADMTYGITRPIYRVDLTDPAGVTYTLNKFDDWFLHGDLLVLYNTIHNYFPVAGSYTVTCYADGFQTFGLTFRHGGFASEAPKGQPVDIMTAATGGGSSSGGGGDAGDTKVMNANLIVDADLMANAKIVVSLGLTDAVAEGIAKRWDDMSKLYVFNKGGETVYTADDYFNAVNAAEAGGQYLTFDAWVASGSAVETPNRPYAVKQVLEDNLLGETSSFNEAVGAAAAELTLTENTDTSATFTGDEAYLAAISELRLNGGLLKAEQYTVSGNTLTVNGVKIGENVLVVTARGYKNSEITFTIEKVLHEVVLTAADIEKGAEIVVTCGTDDFFKYIETVTLTAPNGNIDNVMPDGAESLFQKIGYTVDGTTLTIGKDTLNQAFAQNEDGTFREGVYTVTITADYYGTKTVTLTVTAPAASTNAAPAVKEITYKTQFMGGNYYTVSFEGTEDDTAAFVAAINNININGQKVTPVASFYNDTFSYKTHNDPAFGGKVRFVSFTEDCFQGTANVVISADGYEDLSFTVIDGVFQGGAPVEPAVKPAPTVAKVEKDLGGLMGKYDRVSFEGDVTEYLPAITSVTVNGEEIKAVTNLFGESKAYKLSNDDQFGGADKFMDFTADCFTGSSTLVIEADGYEALTYTHTETEVPPTEPEGPTEPAMKAAPTVADVVREGSIMGKYDRVSFNEDVAEYLPAITSVTVDGAAVKSTINLFGESKAYKLSNDDQFGGADKFMDFTADCFTGSSTLVIEADGYETLTYTQGAVEPEGPTEPEVQPEPTVLPVPGVQHFAFKEDMFRGDHYRLSFNTVDAVTSATGGNGGGGVPPVIPPLPEPTPEEKALYAYVSSLKTYLNEVKDSSITVNGVEITESTNATLNDSSSFLVIADEHDMSRNAVVFNLDCFDNKENAEIVIKVAGYEDLVMSVSGRVVPETPDPTDPTEPEVPQGDLTAPVAVGITQSYYPGGYAVKLGNPEGVTDNQYVYNFLAALTEVKVNDAVLTEAGGFMGKPDAAHYTLNKSNGEITFSLDTLGSGTGEFTVSLKANGYQDVNFWVIDGVLSTEAPAPALPAAPVAVGITQSYFPGGYAVKLGNPAEITDDQYVYNFLAALTEVKVNDAVLTEAGGFMGKPDASHYTLNKSTGEITFSLDTLGSGTGEFTVSLKANGYQDVTFTVIDGSLSDIATAAPAVVFEAPVEIPEETYEPDTGSIFE